MSLLTVLPIKDITKTMPFVQIPVSQYIIKLEPLVKPTLL
jgi:hypothetical protein